MERRPDVDAVFFSGDSAGGRRHDGVPPAAVPQRIAIASFDDWDISRQFETPITALDIPRYRIGELAADLILKRLDKKLPERVDPIDVGFNIIAGGST